MASLPVSMKAAFPEPVALPPGALAPRGFTLTPGVLEAAESTAVRPTKLFIGGISRRTTTKQLRDHFSKYGRVLDCVAMRQPDGRPRGFGYVTLDSPVAAERFLREPQVIDDRIVDMKPAVPEASPTSIGAFGVAKVEATASPMADPMAMFMTMPASDCLLSTPGQAQLLSTPGQAQLLSTPGQAVAPASMSYPWLEDAGFYCDSGFGGVMVPDIGVPPVGPLSHLGHPVLESTDFMSHHHATSPALMVPDCLDILTSNKPPTPNAATGPLLGAPGLSLPISSEEDLAPVKITTASTKHSNFSAGDSRSAPSPLGDVTNLLDDASRPQDLKLSEPVRVETCPAPAPAVLSPVGSDSTQECFVFEDNQVTSGDETAPDSAKPPSPNGSEAVAGAHCDPDLLPSVGSAQHSSGECRRCNFFAKGRCRNGKDCQFCHLPHERRKLSRQEKREQQAARMARESGSTTEDPDDTDCADEDTVDSMPTTSPTSPVAQSGPLMPSVADTPLGAQPAKVLPPGLRPPGLTLPTAPPTQPLLPPHMIRCTPFELAACYTGPASFDNTPATLPPPLLATSPLQQPTYIATSPPPLLATGAPVIAPAAPRPPVKEMCTVSTQTDDDCSWCSHCHRS